MKIGIEVDSGRYTPTANASEGTSDSCIKTGDQDAQDHQAPGELAAS